MNLLNDTHKCIKYLEIQTKKILCTILTLDIIDEDLMGSYVLFVSIAEISDDISFDEMNLKRVFI